MRELARESELDRRWAVHEELSFNVTFPFLLAKQASLNISSYDVSIGAVLCHCHIRLVGGC